MIPYNDINKEIFFRQYASYLKKQTDIDWYNCLEFGEKNDKTDYIFNELGVPVDRLSRIDDVDFNFPVKRLNTYNAIICFEIIEHLVNPFNLMMSIKNIMHPNSVLFISFPSRPRYCYPPDHYNEIPRKHFEKFILRPLHLRIVSSKRIWAIRKFRLFFKPITWLKLPFSYTTIYRIERNEKQ